MHSRLFDLVDLPPLSNPTTMWWVLRRSGHIKENDSLFRFGLDEMNERFTGFRLNWKTARVLPIPKVKTVHSIDDWRAISSLSAISEIVEHILKDQILSAALKLISPALYAFHREHNTTSLLLNLTDTIRSNVNDFRTTSLAASELPKATNNFNHWEYGEWRLKGASGDYPIVYNRLWEWSLVNSLLINTTKSKAMLFGNASRYCPHLRVLLCVSYIEIVDLHRCLGIGYLPQQIRFRLIHGLLMRQVLYELEVVADTKAGIFSRSTRFMNSMVRYVCDTRGREYLSEVVKVYSVVTDPLWPCDILLNATTIEHSSDYMAGEPSSI
uniref:Reverse transcriptase domain-containing protein n=1 Tax=Glossina austeni TaxID=7395 RepID=A0A1A9VYH7_GLOAU